MRKTSLRALPESKLAKLQTLQIGNDCGIHSLLAAIELLTEIKFDHNKIIDDVNRNWFFRGYRIWHGSAIFPHMQVRILKRLSEKYNLPLQAKLLHLSPEVLRSTAEADDIAIITTIYWWFRQAPNIYYSDQPKNYNREKGASGHSMLFAAYDADHISGNIVTPWGFVNSWVNGGNGLFWMSDAEFRKSWAAGLPRWGKNIAVVVSFK